MGAEGMAVEGASPFDLPRLCRYFSERSPQPLVAVEGATHAVRYCNPAFARLAGRSSDELIGRAFAVAVPEGVGNGCLATLDRVFRTGRPESLAEQEHRQSPPAQWSYAAWAILGADGRPAGVMVQVTDATEAASFRRRAVEMNEALVVSSVRQHELLESVQRGEEDRRELVGQLERQNRMLEEMALSDPLTGLPNRRAIERVLGHELVRRARVPAPLAIGLVDADRFKDINTAFLLSGGDHVLTWLAGVLKDSIRGSDSLGRIGGEEFMVVAPGTDAGGAAGLAERLRSNVAGGSTAYGGRPIRVTVSVGFATVEPGRVAGYDQIRVVAEAALQEAKEAGRNRCVVRSV
jgi:diguanylate cyclase (GGDEF)-like protein